jgi:hypothetical protein
MAFEELIMLGGAWVSSIAGVFRKPDAVISKRPSKESLNVARAFPLHPSCPQAAVKANKHGRAVKQHEEDAVDVVLQTWFKANPSSSCLYMSAAAAGVEKICFKGRFLATCLNCAGPTNNGVPICHACQVFGSRDVNDYKRLLVGPSVGLCAAVSKALA